MSGLVLPVGILVAAVAVTGIVASGVLRHRSSSRAIQGEIGRQAFVECPHTRRLARIRVVFDRDRRAFDLAECDHLDRGDVGVCHGECLPSFN